MGISEDSKFPGRTQLVETNTFLPITTRSTGNDAYRQTNLVDSRHLSGVEPVFDSIEDKMHACQQGPVCDIQLAA
jgi:hypothetical protein